MQARNGKFELDIPVKLTEVRLRHLTHSMLKRRSSDIVNAQAQIKEIQKESYPERIVDPTSAVIM